MNIHKNLAFLAFVMAVAALGIALWRAPGNAGAVFKKETAYERVMRTRTLRCGYFLWPVSTEIDLNTRQLKGMVPDFTEALGQKLGLKIEWVQEVPFDQEVEAFNSGKIDAICANDGPFVYTSAAIMDYAESIAYVPIYFYGRSGETRFKDPAAANAPDVTFSAIDGDISLAMAMDQFPRAHVLELPSSADPSFILTNVKDGKADFVLTDPLTVSRFNLNNKPNLARLSDKPMAVISLSFSLPKGNDDLRVMLDQGFQLLQYLGISDQILDRYDPEHKLFYRPEKRWREFVK